MNISITHCTVCFGYRDRALSIANELRRRFDANVEVIGGKLGQFDIQINGELVVSRGRTRLARMKPSFPPDTAKTIASVEQYLASRKAGDGQ